VLTPRRGRVVRNSTATFRFHGDLNDHLPVTRQHVSFSYAFDGGPAVKDALEALGPPHPEVDAIVANGVPVDFAYRVRDGDRVDVYPLVRSNSAACEPARDATVEGRPAGFGSLTPPVSRPPRFILDTHLGRLARFLRMLGFDSAYGNRAEDDELARRSAVEDRIMLTRDRGVLRRSVVRLGYLLRSDDPYRQLTEVAGRYELAVQAQPFSRCIRCNGRIEPVDKADVAERLAPRTLRYYDVFGRCDSCAAVYWQGSHYERMQGLVSEVLKSS